MSSVWDGDIFVQTINKHPLGTLVGKLQLEIVLVGCHGYLCVVLAEWLLGKLHMCCKSGLMQRKHENIWKVQGPFSQTVFELIIDILLYPCYNV